MNSERRNVVQRRKGSVSRPPDVETSKKNPLLRGEHQNQSRFIEHELVVDAVDMGTVLTKRYIK